MCFFPQRRPGVQHQVWHVFGSKPLARRGVPAAKTGTAVWGPRWAVRRVARVDEEMGIGRRTTVGDLVLRTSGDFLFFHYMFLWETGFLLLCFCLAFCLRAF